MSFAAIFKEKNWFTKKFEGCSFQLFFEEKRKQREKNMELSSKDAISRNFWKKKRGSLKKIWN